VIQGVGDCVAVVVNDDDSGGAENEDDDDVTGGCGDDDGFGLLLPPIGCIALLVDDRSCS